MSSKEEREAEKALERMFRRGNDLRAKFNIPELILTDGKGNMTGSVNVRTAKVKKF